MVIPWISEASTSNRTWNFRMLGIVSGSDSALSIGALGVYLLSFRWEEKRKTRPVHLKKGAPPLEETSTQSSNVWVPCQFSGGSYNILWMTWFFEKILGPLCRSCFFLGRPEVISVRNLLGWKRWSLYFWNIQLFWFPAIIYCQEAEASFKMVFRQGIFYTVLKFE